MSRSGSFFTGLFACFGLSFGVAVLAPHYQIGNLLPFYKEEDGVISDVYPSVKGGSAANGRSVYISEGCQACHSQVVRGSESADIERGWGVRRTVARDYIFEMPPVLGAFRLGPDLANVGSDKWRNEPESDRLRPSKRDAEWQFLHLYHPTAVVKGSNMPSYRHLFEKRKVSGHASVGALKLTGDLAPEPGFEIVPNADAKALVAYLSSLDRSAPLKEAGAVAAVAPSKK